MIGQHQFHLLLTTVDAPEIDRNQTFRLLGHVSPPMLVHRARP
jgi:hypothetical protein